jgi:GTP-binding protein
MPLPVVAIVGRPNVGKSTLFNRLIGFKKAVVDDRPGVTRDRLYEEAEILGHRFMVMDTGGLEPAPDSDLLAAMRVQSLVAVEEADVIVFLVDARRGLTPADEEVADLLRRATKPVVLAVNKVDGQKHEELAADFWQLGFDTLHTISSAHGRGIYEMLEAVVAHLPELDDLGEEDELTDEQLSGEFEAPEPVDAIRIAVIGRPNIGKSTLINRLLGVERHLVHDAPGTTMDPVDSVLETRDQRYVLVDTAGVRRKARIDDQLERFVSLRSIRAIERCHVSLLMMDATEGPTDQDARLAELVAARGRALILLLNKWDLVKTLEDVSARSTEDALRQRLPHAIWAPHLFISAKTGKGLHRILPTVNRVYECFDRRVPTAELNRFLEWAVIQHTPPQRYHRPVRLHYCTQARVRPPTFIFFSNTPEGIRAPYRRYLANRLRQEFDFEGTPLRMHFRRRRKLGEGAQ